MILRALGFLACYAAWLYISKLNNSTNQLSKRPLLAATLNGILFGLAFSSFAGLQVGSFNIRITLTLILLGQLSALISLAIGSFLDIKQEIVGACVRWGAIQLSRFRLAKVFVFTPVASALILYPILVVRAIFIPPVDPQLFAVQCAVAFVFWMAIPPMVWSIWGILSTKYWKEHARTSMLLLFASGLLSSFLYFVIFLWSFNLSGSGSTTAFLGTSISYSPRILGLVVLGVLALYFVPYIRGVYLGRRSIKEMHRARREFLNRIIRVLKYPEISDAEGALGQLRDELRLALDTFKKSEPVFELSDLLEDQAFKAEELKADRHAYSIARLFDNRFEALDWLARVDVFLESSKESIAKQTTHEAKREVMVRWVEFFEQYLSELNDHIEASPRGSALVVLGVVASVTMAALFSKVGESLWDMLRESLR